MNLEDELRAALRREDPSPGFAGRVLARAQSRPAPKARIPRFMWAVAMAAMLVIGFAVTSEYRQMKAERAGREAVIALRIAAEKLNQARDKVVRREN
ncbi:MAG: hypothetical protein JWO19_339 [Bryobacterales bacterium]|nr:hypothetical protein [Bryobacterales bacterium]